MTQIVSRLINILYFFLIDEPDVRQDILYKNNIPIFTVLIVHNHFAKFQNFNRN